MGKYDCHLSVLVSAWYEEELEGYGELGSEFLYEPVGGELLDGCWVSAGDERFRRARTFGLGTDSDEEAYHNARHEINRSSVCQVPIHLPLVLLP